jgi:hypothetical protein
MFCPVRLRILQFRKMQRPEKYLAQEWKGVGVLIVANDSDVKSRRLGGGGGY